MQKTPTLRDVSTAQLQLLHEVLCRKYPPAIFKGPADATRTHELAFAAGARQVITDIESALKATTGATPPNHEPDQNCGAVRP